MEIPPQHCKRAGTETRALKDDADHKMAPQMIIPAKMLLGCKKGLALHIID
jgi:hypothetical protein